MKKSLLASVVAAVLLLVSVKAYSDTKAAENHDLKIKEIKQLLEMMGTENTQRQMLKLMIDSFKKDMTSVPTKFWDSFATKMNNDLPALNQKIAAIYDQHFTQADIEALIQFYKTPSGQKYLQELPKVTRESYVVGSEWGKGIGEEVEAELKKAGYE